MRFSRHSGSISPSTSKSTTRPTQSSTRLLSLPTLAASLFLLALSATQIGGAHGAFTAAVSRNNDYVEANADGQMCFYPKAADPSTLDVACVGGARGDYAAVMGAHLNLTTSINYFSGSLERLGGPEWVVNAQGRRIYLCLTGRAGDYTYQTMCTTVGRDNSLGNSTSPFCKVQAGQRRVTDGCYVPNQDPPPLTVTSSSRPAVVTVTRTSTPATSTVTRSAATGNAQNSSTDQEDNAGEALSGYVFLGGVNLAIFAASLTFFWF